MLEDLSELYGMYRDDVLQYSFIALCLYVILNVYILIEVFIVQKSVIPVDGESKFSNFFVIKLINSIKILGELSRIQSYVTYEFLGDKEGWDSKSKKTRSIIIFSQPKSYITRLKNL